MTESYHLVQGVLSHLAAAIGPSGGVDIDQAIDLAVGPERSEEFRKEVKRLFAVFLRGVDILLESDGGDVRGVAQAVVIGGFMVGFRLGEESALTLGARNPR